MRGEYSLMFNYFLFFFLEVVFLLAAFLFVVFFTAFRAVFLFATFRFFLAGIGTTSSPKCRFAF